MSERIMTLFGEEIVPEQPKTAGKTRTKKKGEEQTEEQLPTVNEVATETPESSAQPESKAEVAEATMPVIDSAPVAQEEPQGPAVVEISAEVSTEEPVEAAEPATESTEPVAQKKRAKVNEENIILAEDWHGDKKYYSIGEVAELFKVKTSHIRFWTNEFKIKVRTNRKGDRLFTPEQIKELRAIHHLVKERGFTLTGAKSKLKEQNNMDVQTVDLKQSLLQLRNKLVIIKNQLT